MPRKALVSREDAIKTIEKFIEHFRTDELPRFTSQVWVDMSKDLNHKWTSHGVYVAVRENRRDILSTARKNQGIIMPQDEEEENTCPAPRARGSVARIKKKPDIESQVRAHLKSLKTWLYLTLDGDVWDKIKPRMTFKYGQKQDTYVITSPTEWTEAIFDAFAQEFHFPCAYILKRAKVHDSRDSLHYLEIYAECRSRKCSNRFLGFVDKEPWYGEPLDIKIKTWDTSLDDHETVYRPIGTIKRQVADEEAPIEPSNNRKKRAAKKMRLEMGKTEKAEDEADESEYDEEEEDLDVGDLTTNVGCLKAMPEYLESIQQIGYFPFYVMYTTPRQMHAFNEYCNAEEWSSIKIDMRKDLVGKTFRRDLYSDGKDVFLLSMLFNFNANCFMAYQMISETIDYPLLTYWLSSWLGNGGRKPKEALSNYCRVFLSAMCSAFNGFSLERYIYQQFAAVSGTESSEYEWLRSAPKTCIRVDPKNLRYIVSQWRCFEKVNHSCIREFYIRCLDLLIDANTFEEFTELLSLIIVVGFSAHEDAVLETRKSTPRTIRKKLEAIIARKNNKVEEITDYAEAYHLANDEPVLEDVFVDTEQLKPVTNWVEGLVKDAKSLESHGSELNAYYLPEFAENIVSIALDFPLWTKFTVPRDDTCTRHVEAYFEDWQPRILARVPAHQQFPVRADRFVRAHLDEINEAAATFESMITQFNVERVSADGNLRIKYSGKNVQVTMLTNKDSQSFDEYLHFDKNHTHPAGNDLVNDAPELEQSGLESNQNSPNKTINKDNILSACIVETDELGVCHRRNISLDFSEL